MKLVVIGGWEDSMRFAIGLEAHRTESDALVGGDGFFG